ncbi:MAG: Hsp20/alpha crystallin family protein [Erysipelotrichaceae bacterium]|nr:Hsp20/alpha crystallin family protein [Erysipelotrichaceae bacterium]
MLTPKIFTDNVFDDWFDPFGMMKEMNRVDRKLYGKHTNREMLMDVKDHEDHYEVEIDLPGFRKEDINIELNDGYMTVSASKGLDEDEKDHKGKIVRQERYSGMMSRSFYVGEGITNEEVHAKFENGVLKLDIPKKEYEKIAHKNTIMIE